MKRFLFVVPPFVGHVNPTLAVARALEARGHRVAWTGYPSKVRPLLPPDAELIALDEGPSPQDVAPVEQTLVRGLESFAFLWEQVLVPLARAMRPGVDAAVEQFAPDVMAIDHEAIGGTFSARRAKIPWATMCTTSAIVTDPLATLPKIKEWVDGQLRMLESEAALDPMATPDLSPRRVVVFSTPALVGDGPWPSQYRFCGPSIGVRPDASPFPWDDLAPMPRVLVSLGTVSANSGAAFYATIVSALRDAGVQAIFAAPPELVPDPPPHFIVRRRVPQLALLPHVNAVICHAGHNTVCEALANGLPLVVAPIRDDQPVVAGQVVATGAGVRLKFGRSTAASVRDATMRVLNEPSFREAAARIRDSFRDAGGAEAAADALEGLA